MSAQADLSNADLAPGIEYADGARQSHWVWIGKDGRALDRPDLSAIPDGYVGALGPVRTPDESPAFVPTTPVAASKSGGTAPFQALYRKYHTTGDTPLPNVRVLTALPSGQILSDVTTDASGMASFTCYEGGAYYVYVVTEGVGKINVHYDPNGWFPYNESSVALQISTPPCAPRAETVNQAMANTLEGMRAIEEVYSAGFGYERGPVDVYLKPGNANGLYSIYNNISMGDARLGSARGFHLWAHEYGHAFHHRALGGMPRGKCGRTHYYDGADDYGCAYTEGFAHFTSAVAFDALYFDLYGLSPTESRRYRDTINNLGYPGSPGNSDRPDYIDDGGLIEGPFAAFMWDLYDGPNTLGEVLVDESPFDLTQYPLSYIADVIRSCTWTDGTPRDEDGTDRLISCFENRRVPYSVTFFRLRYEEGGTDYTVYEAATEPAVWDPEHIRTLWRQNLYGVGPQPISVAVNGPMYLAANETGTWWGGVSGASGGAVYRWQTRVHERAVPTAAVRSKVTGSRTTASGPTQVLAHRSASECTTRPSVST